ncbi:MAG: FKBP-type peptidyl-prolyl cis-trans isomerase [Planctomycetota bacterium]
MSHSPVRLPLRPLLLALLLPAGLAGCDGPPGDGTPASAALAAGELPVPVEEPPAPDPAPRTLPGGLVVECLVPGAGRPAGIGDRVHVHYVATLVAAGTEVDSTYRTGIPLALTLGAGEHIRGLERGLEGARRGAKVRLCIPAALAYGEAGMGAIPPSADLVFVLDVIRIE